MKVKNRNLASFVLLPFQATALALLLLIAAPAAADRPERFPGVALTENSTPRYSSLRLDPWGNRVAYLLFDGNIENGYTRIYVWSPGDTQYGNPVLMAIGSDRSFPVIRSRGRHEVDDVDELSDIAWNLRGRATGGGERFDYVTGETRTHGRGYQIYFDVDYIREKRGQRDSRLAMTIPGILAWTADWNAVGAQGQAPWNNLRVQLRTRSHPQGDRMVLRLTSYMHMSNRHQACTVTTMPDAFLPINVSVAPYLKPPIYDSDVTYWNLERNGVEIQLDPRWYTVDWNYEMHPWLGGATRRDSYFMSVNHNP